MYRFVLLLLLALPWPLRAQVASELPPDLRGIGVEERLGSTVPDTLVFVDEDGQPLPLKALLHRGRPVILNFVYYDCPMLCSFVLDGLTKAIRPQPWTPGKEYEIITISFAPNETPEKARKAKKRYLEQLGRPEAAEGWHFLTASARASTTLADAVGFSYRWDEASQQYIHPAALVFLSPEGKITRYLYGIEFPVQDVRLALLEAAEGKVGTTLERVLLYCYQYDPQKGSYALVAVNVMKLGGLLTLLVLGTVLGIFWLRERQKHPQNLT